MNTSRDYFVAALQKAGKTPRQIQAITLAADIKEACERSPEFAAAFADGIQKRSTSGFAPQMMIGFARGVQQRRDEGARRQIGDGTTILGRLTDYFRKPAPSPSSTGTPSVAPAGSKIAQAMPALSAIPRRLNVQQIITDAYKRALGETLQHPPPVDPRSQTLNAQKERPAGTNGNQQSDNQQAVDGKLNNSNQALTTDATSLGTTPSQGPGAAAGTALDRPVQNVLGNAPAPTKNIGATGEMMAGMGPRALNAHTVAA